MTKKDHILQAIALASQPRSQAHTLVWEQLQRSPLLADGRWLEYQVIETEKGYEIVNFQTEDEAMAISVDQFDYDDSYVFLIERLLPNSRKLFVLSENAIIDDIDKVWRRVETRSKKTALDFDQSLLENTNVLTTAGGFKTQQSSDSAIQQFDNSTTEQLNNSAIHQLTPLEAQPFETREEISDLIGNAPGWLLHSGITINALVTALVLTLSHFIQYPDKIEAVGTVTTKNPPLSLQTLKPAVVEEILISEGVDVAKNTPLIYLKNDANRSDVNTMSQWISDYHLSNSTIQKLNNSSITQFPDGLQLGNLQSLYTQLELTHKEYHKILALQGTSHQVRTLQREISNTQRLNRSIQAEETKYADEIALAEKEYERARLLIQEGAISQQDHENAEAKLSQIKRQVENWTKSKIQNDIRRDQLRLESLKITEDRYATLLQYQFKLDELISQLEAGLNAWYKENHIIAESDGTVEYHINLTDKEIIQPNQTIGYVIPEETINEQKYVKVIAGARGIAKLDQNSRAIIKLEAYPYKEYGIIEATISEIARIPYLTQEGEQQYQIKVRLPQPITTSYDNTIEYRPYMIAQISLITEDKSILQRVFDQFLSLIKNNQ